MEPLEGEFAFASQSALLALSTAFVPMPTTFTLVIEILMRMGQSYQMAMEEDSNKYMQVVKYTQVVHDKV